MAQGNWELLIPQPTSNQLVSLYFVDEFTGWSVGEYGTILKTTDGGVNWRIIENPWLYDLSDVFFPSAKVGYAVGTDGHILKTIDGGETWVKQEIKYTNNLNRVRFRDESRGWIIGEKGMILHTDNGGVTWEQQMTYSRENILGIDFMGDAGICAVGTDRTILITSDEGETWQTVIYDTTARYSYSFEDVFFQDEHKGWIGGERDMFGGIILKTNDGGRRWERIKVELGEYEDFSSHSRTGNSIFAIQQIYFASDLLTGLCLIKEYESFGGMGIGSVSNLPLRTTDGGKNWFGKVAGSLEWHEGKGRFTFLNDTYLINTGFQGEFRFSDDGGASWYFLEPERRNWLKLVVGNDGQLIKKINNENVEFYYRTDNRGETWQQFTPQIFESAGTQTRFSDSRDWITLSNDWNTLWTIHEGSICSSTDFGATWRIVKSGVKMNNYRSEILTPDTLIYYQLRRIETASDVYKSILEFTYSFDGGQTSTTNSFTNIWNDITSPDWPIVKSCFLNSHTGFLIGPDGNIIKTTDTGRTWQAMNSGVVEQLRDIVFLSRKVGFVVGDFGRILKTEDGGETWRKTDSGTQQNIYSIAFKNAQEGWVGAENGLRYTTNGGETWQGVPMRYQHGLISHLKFDQKGNGYAYSLSFEFFLQDMEFGRPGGYVHFLRLKNNETNLSNNWETADLPGAYSLRQNFPNPFNATTRIEYQLPKATQISIKIFNIQGQLVRTIMNKMQDTGTHCVLWDGLADDGSQVASGIYVYQLKSENAVKTRKMLLLK